jgi:hypothetical protein
MGGPLFWAPVHPWEGKIMTRFVRLWIASITLVLFANVAAAVPIILQLDSSTTVGGALPVLQDFTPTLPLIGSGDIDFGTGTGTLTLPNYSITLDTGFSGPDGIDDALITTTNWSQTITSIDGSGNITSTGGGSVSCQFLGGIGGLICPSVSTVVAGWPAADGVSLTSSAIIDTVAQTIIVIDNSNSQAGTITQQFSYSIVPEPGTALLMGGGLIGLAMRRRTRA